MVLALTGPGVTGLLAGTARADDDPPAKAAGEPFDGFGALCRGWMEKMAQRKRENFAQTQALREGKRVAFEYTGYGAEPVRCESRVTELPGTGPDRLERAPSQS